MSTSYFKDNENLVDSSNFSTWKIRLEVIMEENDVLEYVQGKVLDPPANAFVVVKSRYKKGDLKVKNIIIDGLQDHLLAYVGSLKASKDIYAKMIGMYEVNNLNHILSLKDQLKEIKMNKGELVQSYIMRVSCSRDQLQATGEHVSNRELV